MVYHQEALVAMHLSYDWFILYIHIHCICSSYNMGMRDFPDIHSQARGPKRYIIYSKMRLSDAEQACME